MKTTHYENLGGRPMRGMTRIALRVAYLSAIWAGLQLFFTVFLGVFEPRAALMGQKVISVIGGREAAVILALGLCLLGLWLRRKLMVFLQRENDRTAQRIMRELRADPEASVGEFYLYLRAFETTGKLRVPLYMRLRKLSSGMSMLETDDLESYATNALRRVAPLIALGQPGEAIGAGRIVSEDKNWQVDIVTLMRHAKGILLVPSNRPGTLWEIDTLKKEDLLHKVIFIMPPRTKGELDIKKRWEIVRQVMATRDLAALPYQEWGLLFKVRPGMRISNIEPLLLNSVRQLRKSLQRILSDRPPKHGLSNAFPIAHKRALRATFWGWMGTLYMLSPYPMAAVALFLPQPYIGFNPGESWSTVVDRTTTMAVISDNELSENIKLAMSEKYLDVEARVPPEQFAEWRQGLILSGLLRLDDDNLRAYFTALGDMLARLDTKTCAAISRGEIKFNEMRVALTYIPADRISGYLHAQTAATLAEVEGIPVPSFDENAVSKATQQFLTNLVSEDQQRYQRINQARERLSDDDQCWLLRVLYGSVATLAEPHASAWARTLAVMATSTDDSTEQEQIP